LTFNPATAADSGSYAVVVTNTCGTVTSDTVVVTVLDVPNVTINEIRTDQTGTDNDEYFELAGAPGTSLNNVTYIVIGDNATDSCGRVEAVISLNGLSIPADGHFLASESTLTLPCADARDVTFPSSGNALNFENTDNVTHLIVLGFTGTNGQDLDTNDDGILDVTPWATVLDSVSIVITPGAPDCYYSSAVVGPDRTFAPGHVYRCPDMIGSWFVGTFDPTCHPQETPGRGNPPCILTQPANVTACIGSPATFTVGAAGTPPVSYQWKKDGNDISGATASSYSIASVGAGDAGSYTVVVTDAYGTATSNAATLTAGSPTAIATQPQSQQISEGAPLSLSVVATGQGPLSYQWRKDGFDISGATSSTFAIASTVVGDSGSYDVVVTGPCGTATSDAAVVVVRRVPAVVINEIRTNEAGPNVNEYFELAGAPGTSLDGLSYVVIGDGAGGSGVVEAVVNLTGYTIPADGHFLAVEDMFSLACADSADLVLSSAGNALNFENDHNATHLLALDFSGSLGQDLDVDDDCVLDVTPWFTVVDHVALVSASSVPPDVCAYGTTTVGPDGSVVPSHVLRCPDAVGSWHVGPSGTCQTETPGLGNPPCIVVGPADLTVCEGQSAAFTVTAAGTGSLSYQWFKDGLPISGATSSSYTIAFVVIEDAGLYSVQVDDVYGFASSAGATLTVQPFFSIRRGNINSAAGPTANVLFVNGSAGSDPEREVVLSHTGPLTIDIVNPPSKAPGQPNYAMYAWRGRPTKADQELLPGNIGTIAMPTPLSGRTPHPIRIANNIGGPFGTENWFARFRPTQRAPYTLFQTPMIRRTGTFYIQGVIFDNNAPNGLIGVTNGIVLTSN
jgi:Ig-like domain-containing protein/immunoglobulin I-set domain protein